MEDTPLFLKDALKFGINLGLERMNALDELLGNPEKKLNVVHVAGTNGKGSTVAFISSILAASGKKVGVYTSPFLERFSERMRIINGREGLLELEADETAGEIPSEDLERISKLVEEASDRMIQLGMEHPTEFELVTAICYIWFAEQNVDIAVLETGLGGRLDSTNVIEKPCCTVITAMGLDHTDRLGETIDLIAAEKAGIFKAGSPAVAYEPDEMIINDEYKPIIRDVFVHKAEEIGTQIEFVRVGDAESYYSEDARMHFRIQGDENEYVTRLSGRHQINNAAVAISCVRKIPGVTQEDISFGIEHTVWKGRAECLSLSPIVFMDGGHNDQGAQSLARVLDDIWGCSGNNLKWRAVIGVMKDKDVDGMLQKLKDGGIRFEEVNCTLVSNSRSMNPDELSDKIKNVYNNLVKVTSYEDACSAVADAYSRSLEDGIPLLVTGSLYLVGEVRGALKKAISDSRE